MRWGSTGAVLVARTEELARLDALVADLLAGRGAIALVSGEAGVGKTRLVTEAAQRAAARGVTATVGHCVDLGEGLWPLGTPREIVSGLLASLDEATRDDLLGPGRMLLGQLLPELGADDFLADPLPAANVCELLVGVMRRFAARRPLLVVVEDLHWSGPLTQMLLTMLARPGAAILVIGTFRSDELHARHPWRPALAELVRTAQPERISLEPFDCRSTAVMVDSLAPLDANDSLRSEVFRRSGGNAFFIEELVAAAKDGVCGVPESLRDVLLARAARLDGDAMHVLRALAVGGAAPLDVLAAVCELETREARAVLDTLVTTALLVAGEGEARFRHELGREAFDAELHDGERIELHVRWAQSLTRLRPDRLGDIARHWCAAENAASALETSVAAGRAALRGGAPGEAEVHLLRALELWSDVDAPSMLVEGDHAALLLDASVAARHANHPDTSESLALRAVAELEGEDPMREGIVWLHLRNVYRDHRRWNKCADAVERAIAVIPASPPSAELAEALADVSRQHVYANRGEEATEYGRRAVAAAEAAGAPEALVSARTALAGGLSLLGKSDDLAFAEQTVAMCGPDLPAETTLHALNGLARALGRLGRSADVLAVAERGVRLAREHGIGGFCASTMAQYCVGCAAELGRWAEAEAMVIEYADLLGDPSRAGELARVWGLVLARQGRLDEARPLIDAARARVDTGEWESLSWIAVAVVRFDTLEGRFADAAHYVADVLGHLPVTREGAAELVAAGVAALAAGVLTAGRDRAVSASRAAVVGRSWIDMLEGDASAPWRGYVVDGIFVEEANALLSELLGRPDPAAWSRVADGWAAVHYPWEEAHARMRHGEALLAGTAGRGHAPRVAAAAELAHARTIAVGLAARPLLADIDGLLRRARLDADGGPDPRPLRCTDGLGLTRRERDVLALLGDGRTNGQIARELFISTKTASVHVSNILRKLGVANRIEAATVADRANGGAAGAKNGSVVDWLHEVSDCPVADLLPMGDAVVDGVAEVEPDEDSRFAVLGGGVGQAVERTHHG